MEIVKAEKVSKNYSGFQALSEVSLSVEKGQIFGLLGPNGAGKTTFIRIINQITAPDSGQVMFMGRPLKRDDIYNIGYLPEERGLYKKMKVGEQSLYLAQLKGLDRKTALKRLKYWFEKFEIETWWDKRLMELSKGMQQKVQFICTVIHEPELLIFDEPFSGFDPINATLIKDEILELKKKGTSIIFSTHNMSSVEEICDHIALFNKSNKILDGNIHDIKSSFPTNLFDVEYKGNFASVAEKLTSEFEVIDHIESHHLNKLTVKNLEHQSSNGLITQLLPVAQIVSFAERIPSMNDVFIRVVEENNEKIQKK